MTRLLQSKKSSALAAIALMTIALAGCQAIEKMEREGYQRSCDNLGIARGTPTYDQCMLQQQALDEESSQRMLDRNAEREASRRYRAY
ncbi:hypothetical protein ACFQU1_17090 [Chelatococcus sp. GCM10030263]|uniref:hypothetical protein n=1 Tax=Chelatococcus sp. GCM10030263 TaxID=3273387 RepID=UPI003612E1CF